MFSWKHEAYINGWCGRSEAVFSVERRVSGWTYRRYATPPGTSWPLQRIRLTTLGPSSRLGRTHPGLPTFGASGGPGKPRGVFDMTRSNLSQNASRTVIRLSLKGCSCSFPGLENSILYLRSLCMFHDSPVCDNDLRS